MRIVRDDRSESSERDEEIRLAALTPVIYRDLWARAQQGVSDESLAYYLKVDRGFADSAVTGLIQTFHKTLAHAELDPSDTMSEEPEDKPPEEDSQLADAQTPGMALKDRPTGRKSALATPDHRTYRLPLPSRDEAVLQVPGALDEGGMAAYDGHPHGYETRYRYK